MWGMPFSDGVPDEEKCWADKRSAVISTGNELLSTCNAYPVGDLGLCETHADEILGSVDPKRSVSLVQTADG